MNGKLLHHPLGHLLAILLLGALGYLNSFGVPFVLDDLEAIPNNAIIRDLGNYLPGGPGYDYLLRRWVGYFSFALNYQVGGLDVAGYHLFNLVVHLGTALLVYALVRQTFRTPSLAGSRLAPQAGLVALLAALFFVAHPVQTQAVTYIFQRLASLCTFFYLLALVLYATARIGQARSGQECRGSRGPTADGWRIPLLLTGTLTAAILAMFTKEIAFTLPLAALLYECCFFRGQWQQRARMLLPLLLTLAIIPATVLSGAELADDGTLRESNFDIPRTHYLATQLRVIVTYLRLLLLPVNQNLDYDYPIYSSFFSPPVLLSFLLLAAIFGVAVYLCWRTRPFAASPGEACLAPTEQSASPLPPHPSGFAETASPRPEASELRLIAFGIFWFFLALVVESCFVPLDDVIFEHRLYLPSIGLAVALAVGIVLAKEGTAAWFGGRLPVLAAALAIAGLTFATWQRNQVWRSEISLWEDAARKSPGKARPWYNLGTHLADASRPAEAIPPLTRAIALEPQHADAWHNLGRAYLLLDRSDDAVLPLTRAVSLNPQLDNAILNLAVALIRCRHFDAAVAHLEQHRRRAPDWPELHLQLGIAYAGTGDLVAARRQLATLRRLAPQLTPPLVKLLHEPAASLPAD